MTVEETGQRVFLRKLKDEEFEVGEHSDRDGVAEKRSVILAEDKRENEA